LVAQIDHIQQGMARVFAFRKNRDMAGLREIDLQSTSVFISAGYNEAT